MQYQIKMLHFLFVKQNVIKNIKYIMNKIIFNITKNVIGVGTIATVATVLFIEYVKYYEKTHKDELKN